MALVNIEGHAGLFKDMRTGAVINKDKQGLLAAKKLKENTLKMMSMETRLSDIEKLLEKVSNGTEELTNKPKG